VKPSTVNGGDKISIDKVFNTSNKIFESIVSEVDSISKQKHYKIYSEKPKSHPSYKNYTNNTETLNLRNNIFNNYRRSIEDGFLFDCYFVDMPYYIPWLISKYKDTGGEIIYNKVSNIKSYDKKVVNCTGYWSRKLLNDDSVVAKRGHLLQVNKNIKLNHDSETFSYSYKMKDNRFIYGYPRNKSLLLGGSSENGTQDPDKQIWKGEKSKDLISINDKNIPEHIYKENKKLLKDILGIKISKNDDISVLSGYRPFRKKGVRVEEDENISNLYHNYGHGGSGLTLSYGCAHKILNLIRKSPIDTKDLVYKISNAV
jgi:D-amino-acid oxidase